MESFFHVLILIEMAGVQYSQINYSVKLFICFPKGSILALFEGQKLIRHIYTLFVFDLDIILNFCKLIGSESAELPHINLLVVVTMSLGFMQFELIGCFECNEFLLNTVLVIAHIVRHFIMFLKRAVVLIVTIFFMGSADMTIQMLKVQMHPEFLFIKKSFITEFAFRMHEDDVPKLIYVSACLMLLQCFKCI